MNLFRLLPFVIIALFSIFLINRVIEMMYEDSYRGARDRTCQEMKKVALEIESYHIDNGVYPENLALLGFKQPLLDAWEQEIVYTKEEEAYMLISDGQDRDFSYLFCVDKEKKKAKSLDLLWRVLRGLIHLFPIFFIIYLAVITFGKNREGER